MYIIGGSYCHKQGSAGEQVPNRFVACLLLVKIPSFFISMESKDSWKLVSIDNSSVLEKESVGAGGRTFPFGEDIDAIDNEDDGKNQ